MNPSISLSRSCAQHCCRTRTTALRKQPFTQHQQLPFRSITSTSSQAYAQPSTTTTITNSTPDDLPFSHLQTPLNTSTSTETNPSRLPQDQNQPAPSHLFIGTISRTGTMPQTVQITRNHLVYDPFLQKHYTRPLRLKAHDPNPATYLREGDVVEYGVYTQIERDARAAKDEERVRNQEERLEKVDKSGKAVRKFQRDEETKKMLRGRKRRGVQFVVRRVVTPFGVGLDERMEKLGKTEEVKSQERAVKSVQGSTLRNLGGSKLGRTS